MLSQLPVYKDEPFIQTAYEICRWHHERYDGKGYPDGLKGDEIRFQLRSYLWRMCMTPLPASAAIKGIFPSKAMEMGF